MLQVGIDATPLLGQRTGIGRYVEHLLEGLAQLDDLEMTATAFSLRGLGDLPAEVPEGMKINIRPFPANVLQRSWMKSDRPSVTKLGLGKVQVVHGTNYVLGPLGKGQHGVLTIHDLAYLHSPGLVDETSLRYRALVPRGLARTDVLVTPSQATADLVTEAYSFDPGRVVVTNLGVDPGWFEPQAPVRGLPDDYLVAVGTLEPRKGLDVLLDALRLLHRRRADVPPAVLVGPAGWGPELDLSGLPDDAVLFPGWIDTDTLRGVVAHARALVFPSRDEGFGLPPLEAMAVGTPVLASDLPVTREVLGGHALLSPVGDVEALADGLLRVLDAPRGQAVEHARSYTWARCAEQTRVAYERAAAS